MELDYYDMTVLKLLGYGEANAITQSEISQRTGFSTRTIRHIINSLRQKYCPIISGNSGYYLSFDEDELVKMAKKLLREADTIMATAYCLIGSSSEAHTADFMEAMNRIYENY